MVTRYGDANQNGADSDEAAFNMYEGSNMRPSRHYSQVAGGQQRVVSGSIHQPVSFKEFTRASLATIEKRRSSKAKRASQSQALQDTSRPEPEPDPCLASGQQLPPALARQLPVELVGKPIEDIDPFYADQEVSLGAFVSRNAQILEASTISQVHFSHNKSIVDSLILLPNPIPDLCDNKPVEGAHPLQCQEVPLPVRPSPSN